MFKRAYFVDCGRNKGKIPTLNNNYYNFVLCFKVIINYTFHGMRAWHWSYHTTKDWAAHPCFATAPTMPAVTHESVLDLCTSWEFTQYRHTVENKCEHLIAHPHLRQYQMCQDFCF